MTRVPAPPMPWTTRRTIQELPDRCQDRGEAGRGIDRYAREHRDATAEAIRQGAEGELGDTKAEGIGEHDPVAVVLVHDVEASGVSGASTRA